MVLSLLVRPIMLTERSRRLSVMLSIEVVLLPRLTVVPELKVRLRRRSVRLNCVHFISLRHLLFTFLSEFRTDAHGSRTSIPLLILECLKIVRDSRYILGALRIGNIVLTGNGIDVGQPTVFINLAPQVNGNWVIVRPAHVCVRLYLISEVPRIATGIPLISQLHKIPVVVHTIRWKPITKIQWSMLLFQIGFVKLFDFVLKYRSLHLAFI